MYHTQEKFRLVVDIEATVDGNMLSPEQVKTALLKTLGLTEEMEVKPPRDMVVLKTKFGYIKSLHPCNAKFHHGPGHQSTTPCMMTGDHKYHECRYGSYDQWAVWEGPECSSGYFDEPPEEPEDYGC